MTPALDIISDIHGDLDRMEGLLETLGFDLVTYIHPDGNIAAFLGDFIDRGSENLAVLRRMDAMRRAGSAIALMATTSSTRSSITPTTRSGAACAPAPPATHISMRLFFGRRLSEASRLQKPSQS